MLPPQTVTVQDSGGTQSWNITIIGNTVARKTAAAALVLDRSGSMSEDRGDGQSKHTSLQQAASIFVDVMLEGDGVGVVRFNQDAQVLQPIVQLGNGGLSDINRSNTKDIINGTGLDPNGQTSIGDGIFEGRGILNSAATPFDVKSLVVLTDGVENRSRTIADVASDINEFTYAVGLGQPQNISVPALQTISGNNGGYLLVTGAIGTDNRFLLQKYFLQILAGISNAEIVLDPEGQLIPGRMERVPFQLTAADAGVEVTPATGSAITVAMPEGDDSQFTAQFATTRSGVYRFRIRARGTTLSGEPFTRERILTGAVWRGGDHASDPGSNGQIIVDYLRERDARLCEMLSCFFQRDGTLSAELEQRLRALGIDLDYARKCLAEFCRG